MVEPILQFLVPDECDVMRFCAAREKRGHQAMAVQNTLGQPEAKHLRKQLDGPIKIHAMNLPMVHARRLHTSETIRPWSGIHISQPVTDLLLFRVQLYVVAGWNLKSNPLSSCFQFACGDVLHLATEVFDGFA